MTKYLVKETSALHENNSIFTKELHIYYTGKKGKLVACSGCSIKGLPEVPQDDYFTRTYGFDRLCDAKRAYAYKNCYDKYFDGGHWSNSVEIVTVEVRG